MLTSIPLFEVSQTINDVTTTTSYGIGYGAFILIVLYFTPTFVRLTMARFYPKKTIFDDMDLQTILSLLPVIMRLFSSGSAMPKSSFTSQRQRPSNNKETEIMFEILRQKSTQGATDTKNTNANESTDSTNNVEPETDVSILTGKTSESPATETNETAQPTSDRVNNVDANSDDGENSDAEN